jgi:dTDP-4-dehydrorhamnose reductase
MSAPILLLGRSGQIGRELCRTLAPIGDVAAFGREQLDLRDADAIQRTLRDLRPAVIVNAAAWTDVDAAEDNRDSAFAINADAPAALARHAADSGALLVHFSTDYVFDGRADVPYREADTARPINVYGESKWEGERRILESGARCLILRTGWVYGRHGKNFARTILQLAREREELAVVNDQIGCPNWCRTIAQATTSVMARFAGRERFEVPRALLGVHHVSAAGRASWYDFACAILRLDPLRHEHRCRTIRPVATGAFPRAADRPRFSVLDTSRLAETFGIRLPAWETQLASALQPDSSGDLDTQPVSQLAVERGGQPSRAP